MGDFIGGRNPVDRTGEQAQPFGLLKLGPPLKQELHPEADAEEGLFHRFLPDDRQEAGLPQHPHRVGEGPDPREDKPVGLLDAGRVAGDFMGKAEVSKGVVDAEEVPRPVVDDGDHGCPSLQHAFGAEHRAVPRLNRRLQRMAQRLKERFQFMVVVFAVGHL